MVVSMKSEERGERGAEEEEENHSWSRNALGSFGEVTGASSVRAG